MVYKTKNFLLNVIQKVLVTNTNDVYVCNDLENKTSNYYTVVIIKDHSIGWKIIKDLENNRQNHTKKDELVYIEYFSIQEDIGIVFPYVHERPLNQFYMGRLLMLSESEEICTNLILHCLSSCLPKPLLYLILSQEMIHIARDNRISFSYTLDLGSYDETKQEKDCAGKCGELIVKLLEQCNKRKVRSLELIRKKTYKGGYENFIELYKDLQLAATSTNKVHKKRKWNGLFRLLIIICIFLTFLALIMLLSQLIFGEISLYRLLSNPFNRIGTETLTK